MRAHFSVSYQVEFNCCGLGGMHVVFSSTGGVTEGPSLEL